MNRDIEVLRGCRGMMDEIKRLREIDDEEQRAILGGQRLDGMPHGHGGNSGLEDVMEKAESIHQRRMDSISAYERQVKACETILEKVEDAADRALMRAIYVEQLPIWKAADVAHMSVATAKRRKSQAESRKSF